MTISPQLYQVSVSNNLFDPPLVPVSVIGSYLSHDHVGRRYVRGIIKLEEKLVLKKNVQAYAILRNRDPHQLYAMIKQWSDLELVHWDVPDQRVWLILRLGLNRETMSTLMPFPFFKDIYKLVLEMDDKAYLRYVDIEDNQELTEEHNQLIVSHLRIILPIYRFLNTKSARIKLT